MSFAPEVTSRIPQDKLAIAAKNNDILGQRAHDEGRIKMALKATLGGLEKLGGLNALETIAPLEVEGVQKMSNFYGLQFFMLETAPTTAGAVVKCRFTDTTDKRTYYAALDAAGAVSNVYTADEYESLGSAAGAVDGGIKLSPEDFSPLRDDSPKVVVKGPAVGLKTGAAAAEDALAAEEEAVAGEPFDNFEKIKKKAQARSRRERARGNFVKKSAVEEPVIPEAPVEAPAMELKKVIIVYHSGTGGTKAICDKFREMLRARYHVDMIEANSEFHGDLSEYDMVLFGFPTFRLRPSPSITQFVERLRVFDKPIKAYAFCTKSTVSNNTLRIFAELLLTKNIIMMGHEEFRAPASDVILDFPEDLVAKVRRIWRSYAYGYQPNARKKIRKVVDAIDKIIESPSTKLKMPRRKAWTLFWDYVQKRFFDNMPINVAPLQVIAERCIKCGLCTTVSVCPKQAWSIVGDNLPEWTKDLCCRCMNCVHKCPYKAIMYDESMKDRPRLTKKVHEEARKKYLDDSEPGAAGAVSKGAAGPLFRLISDKIDEELERSRGKDVLIGYDAGGRPVKATLTGRSAWNAKAKIRKGLFGRRSEEKSVSGPRFLLLNTYSEGPEKDRVFTLFGKRYNLNNTDPSEWAKGKVRVGDSHMNIMDMIAAYMIQEMLRDGRIDKPMIYQAPLLTGGLLFILTEKALVTYGHLMNSDTNRWELKKYVNSVPEKSARDIGQLAKNMNELIALGPQEAIALLDAVIDAESPQARQEAAQRLNDEVSSARTAGTAGAIRLSPGVKKSLAESMRSMLDDPKIKRDKNFRDKLGYISSYVDQYERYGRLSDRQWEVAADIVSKYWQKKFRSPDGGAGAVQRLELDSGTYEMELYDTDTRGAARRTGSPDSGWLARLKGGMSFAVIRNAATGKVFYLADNHGLLPLALEHFENKNGIDRDRKYTAISLDYHADKGGVWTYKFFADSGDWYLYERAIDLRPEQFTFETERLTWVSEGNFWTYLASKDKLSGLINVTATATGPAALAGEEMQLVDMKSHNFPQAERIRCLLFKTGDAIKEENEILRQHPVSVVFTKCHPDRLEKHISGITGPMIASICLDELDNYDGDTEVIGRFARTIREHGDADFVFAALSTRFCKWLGEEKDGDNARQKQVAAIDKIAESFLGSAGAVTGPIMRGAHAKPSMQEAIKAGKTVFSYLAEEDPLPETAGLIFVFGNYDPPLARLAARVYFRYKEKNKDLKIAVTGKYGNILMWLLNGCRPEGSFLKKVLLECGVPGSDIIVENKSRNTAENVLFAEKVLSERGVRLSESDTVILMQSAFGQKRASATFRKHFPRVKAVSFASTSIPRISYDSEMQVRALLNLFASEFSKLLFYSSWGSKFISDLSIDPDAAKAANLVVKYLRTRRFLTFFSEIEYIRFRYRLAKGDVDDGVGPTSAGAVSETLDERRWTTGEGAGAVNEKSAAGKKARACRRRQYGKNRPYAPHKRFWTDEAIIERLAELYPRFVDERRVLGDRIPEQFSIYVKKKEPGMPSIISRNFRELKQRFIRELGNRKGQAAYKAIRKVYETPFGYYCAQAGIDLEILDLDNTFSLEELPRNLRRGIMKSLDARLEAGRALGEALRSALLTLTPRERSVLVLCFGLYGYPAFTQRGSELLFHVSKSRIQQIMGKAMRKMQHRTRINMLLESLESMPPSAGVESAIRLIEGYVERRARRLRERGQETRVAAVPEWTAAVSARDGAPEGTAGAVDGAGDEGRWASEDDFYFSVEKQEEAVLRTADIFDEIEDDPVKGRIYRVDEALIECLADASGHFWVFRYEAPGVEPCAVLVSKPVTDEGDNMKSGYSRTGLSQVSLYEMINQDGSRRDLPYLYNEFLCGIRGRDASVLVMRLFPEGVTLDEAIEGGLLDGWSFYRKSRLALSLARTIQYLHRQGVVHRDLAPTNIIIPAALLRDPDSIADNPPLVVDYSSAIAHEQRFAVREFVGTMGYSVPVEMQLALEKELAGNHLDRFGLGVIMAELFGVEGVRDLLVDPSRKGSTFDGRCYFILRKASAPGEEIRQKIMALQQGLSAAVRKASRLTQGQKDVISSLLVLRPRSTKVVKIDGKDTQDVSMVNGIKSQFARPSRRLAVMARRPGRGSAPSEGAGAVGADGAAFAEEERDEAVGWPERPARAEAGDTEGRINELSAWLEYFSAVYLQAEKAFYNVSIYLDIPKEDYNEFAKDKGLAKGLSALDFKWWMGHNLGNAIQVLEYSPGLINKILAAPDRGEFLGSIREALNRVNETLPTFRSTAKGSTFTGASDLDKEKGTKEKPYRLSEYASIGKHLLNLAFNPDFLGDKKAEARHEIFREAVSRIDEALMAISGLLDELEKADGAAGKAGTAGAVDGLALSEEKRVELLRKFGLDADRLEVQGDVRLGDESAISPEESAARTERVRGIERGSLLKILFIRRHLKTTVAIHLCARQLLSKLGKEQFDHGVYFINPDVIGGMNPKSILETIEQMVFDTAGIGLKTGSDGYRVTSLPVAIFFSEKWDGDPLDPALHIPRDRLCISGVRVPDKILNMAYLTEDEAEGRCWNEIFASLTEKYIDTLYEIARDDSEKAGAVDGAEARGIFRYTVEKIGEFARRVKEPEGGADGAVSVTGPHRVGKKFTLDSPELRRRFGEKQVILIPLAEGGIAVWDGGELMRRVRALDIRMSDKEGNAMLSAAGGRGAYGHIGPHGLVIAKELIRFMLASGIWDSVPGGLIVVEKRSHVELFPSDTAGAVSETRDEGRGTKDDGKLEEAGPVKEAKEAGLAIPTNLHEGRYTLLVDQNIYAGAVEYKNDIRGYRLADGRHIGAGDRFNLEKVNTLDVDNILAHVKDPERTIVQVSGELAAGAIDKLNKEAPGIRVIRVDTADFKLMDANERRNCRFDLYAMMLAARQVTETDIQNETSTYRALQFFLNSHYKDGTEDIAPALAGALVRNDMVLIIKYNLSYRPAERWRKPSYHLIAAALISA